MAKMYSVGMDEINYQNLIQTLSKKPYYPLSIHLRNHLLAAYEAQHNPPDASKQDPWTTYKNYREGVQLVIIGDVPEDIIECKSNRRDPQQEQQEPGLWGIAILFPAKTSINQKETEDEKQDTDHIWHDMRLLLWLSSETDSSDKVSIDNVKVATNQEETLLDFLLNNFLSKAIPLLCKDRNIPFGKENIVDLFAVNEAWVQVMRKWTEKGDSRIQLTRANPCMTFFKSEADTLLESSDIDTRWKIDEIKSREEVTLVQCANSMRFSRWYLNQRKHISTFIRDGDSIDQIDIEYPTMVHKGSPAAWAYAHDDLSIASLHVATPYRRSGLGKACVKLMSEKLIQAQKQALSKAGCHNTATTTTTTTTNIPTPLYLDTEMNKGASRLFFESHGFTGIVVATWGSIIFS